MLFRIPLSHIPRRLRRELKGDERIYIHKSHNVAVLMYHMVFPAKYRRGMFDGKVDKVLKEICGEIETVIR